MTQAKKETLADVEAFANAFARLLAGDTSMLTCTRCGKTGSCGCWVKCSCGWSAGAGEPCGNPETTRCSTKVQFGVYNRRTRRYEPKESQ